MNNGLTTMQSKMVARPKTGLERARELLKPILEDQTYLDMLKVRAQSGSLASGVEQMIWHYVYGKVVDKAEIKVTTEDLSAMTERELIAELDTIKVALEMLEQRQLPRKAIMEALAADDADP